MKLLERVRDCVAVSGISPFLCANGVCTSDLRVLGRCGPDMKPLSRGSSALEAGGSIRPQGLQTLLKCLWFCRKEKNTWSTNLQKIP